MEVPPALGKAITNMANRCAGKAEIPALSSAIPIDVLRRWGLWVVP